MYAVVGCSDCQALWVIEGRPDRSQCPRCGTTRAFEKRRQFVTTEDEDHAREVRASMLAARSGHDEAFADLDSFAELDAQVESAGIDDETYLDAAGLDADEVADAAEQKTESAGASGQSREATVREALREVDDPTEAAVVAYAEERGVPPEYTERALAKLRRAGEVSEHRGTYRLL
jgi:hypothetical protein